MPRLLFIACLLLCACDPYHKARQDIGSITSTDAIKTQTTPPASTDQVECWGQATQPAIFETITAQVQIMPAAFDTDGRQISPAVYGTKTRQQMVRQRRNLWFQTPCPTQTDLSFIATLQRALTVRGYYNSPISGTYDEATRAAIKLYQAPRGLISDQLALTTAQQLGVLAF